MSIFENLQVASWQVGSSLTFKFPTLRIAEGVRKRIVRRERPYRDGAKLDDVGRGPLEWTVEAIFENSIDEPGLDPNIPLYPNVLAGMVDTVNIQQTGNLILPTRGKVRVKLESYQRNETEQTRDYASVSFVFVEDNEDSVTAQKFEKLKVNSSAKRLTDKTVFSAESEGVWSTSLADLREFGSDLEAFSNFPGDSKDNIDSQVGIVVSTANSVLRNHKNETEELADPDTSVTQRRIEETKDLAYRARSEPGAGRPRLIPYVVPQSADLWSIGSKVGQDGDELLRVNPGVDAVYVIAGTVINIFETQSNA